MFNLRFGFETRLLPTVMQFPRGHLSFSASCGRPLPLSEAWNIGRTSPLRPSNTTDESSENLPDDVSISERMSQRAHLPKAKLTYVYEPRYDYIFLPAWQSLFLVLGWNPR
jgi:hypothetical protein